jgi:sigma-B regulation protein RsbU (phosphoserine phosphatase)
MFKSFRSIESRLIFWVLAGTSMIFLLTYFFLYRQFQVYTTDNIRREAQLLTTTLAREIDASMQGVGSIARQMASAVATVQPNAEELDEMLRHFVSDNEQLFGSMAAFDENRFAGRKRMCLSIHQTENGLQSDDLSDNGNRYWDQNWYDLTWRRRAPMWHEPTARATSSSVLTATYATPIPDSGNGRPVGILTVDISVETLRQRVRSAMAGRKGFAIVLSGSGLILDHPNTQFIGQENFGGLVSKGLNPEYRRIAERIATGRADVTSVEDQFGETQWVAYAPLTQAGWSLIYVVPESEFLADVAHLLQVGGLWALLGMMLLAILVVYMARSISWPLKLLAAASHQIAQGKLNFRLPDVDQDDEIGALTKAFSRMRDSLRHSIGDLKDATTERKKLESELDIAAQIQRGMLKDEHFVREEPVHFEIAAMLKPAKAVGGDFYEYVELPENQLCLVVGDVSDKGVHAALFMARAITAVRSATSQYFEPDQILSAVNAELCRNNDACMFATVFCIVQDLRFGYLRFASAGHEPAILLNPLGEAHYLEQESGAAVGLDEDAEYPNHKVRLKPGEVVVLYTDGVTEAANMKGEMYGDDRLLKSLQHLLEADADKAMATVTKEVFEFVAGAPPADDLTMLTLRYGTPRSKDIEAGMERLWKQSLD